MMVADKAAGAARAYSARETGKMFANPMLFRTWKVTSQPIETCDPELAAVAAPVAREMNPVTAMTLPMPILMISGGSGNFFRHSRQNTTAPARKLTDTIESSVMSQVVGIFLPKKIRFTFRSTQTRYALKIC